MCPSVCYLFPHPKIVFEAELLYKAADFCVQFGKYHHFIEVVVWWPNWIWTPTHLEADTDICDKLTLIKNICYWPIKHNILQIAGKTLDGLLCWYWMGTTKWTQIKLVKNDKEIVGEAGWIDGDRLCEITYLEFRQLKLHLKDQFRAVTWYTELLDQLTVT